MSNYNLKRLTAIILTALIVTLLLSSCEAEEDGDLHTLYFKELEKREEVVAVFENQKSKATKEVKMAEVDEDEDG